MCSLKSIGITRGQGNQYGGLSPLYMGHWVAVSRKTGTEISLGIL